jgi:AcrR family transcriptional regulator
MTDRSVRYSDRSVSYRVLVLDRRQSTREALLNAGAVVAEEHGLAGLSVNRVVAAAGLAKGTFYVHFADRGEFMDALHERFYGRLEDAVERATGGMPPGAERLYRAAEIYLDDCLSNRAVKALALEARGDASLVSALLARRHDRFADRAAEDFDAMGWRDSKAAAQLLSAMTAEIAAREFDASRRLPASRRALRRFIGIT